MKLSKKLQMKETKQINKLKISVSSVDFNSNQIAPLLWLENKTQLYSIFFCISTNINWIEQRKSKC